MKNKKLKKLLESRCLPAFNFSNLEVLQTILEVAKENRANIIVQISEKSLRSLIVEGISVDTIIKNVEGFPLNLDHSCDPWFIKECLIEGFDSVCVDSRDRNAVRELAKFVHARDKLIEGGTGKETINPDEWTKPDEAAEFARMTGLDLLKVAVGNVNGVEPDNLNFKLLEEIHHAVDLPLVLHGGSFIPKGDIKRAISLGIRKINFNTEIKIAYNEGGLESVKKVVREKIDWINPKS